MKDPVLRRSLAALLMATIVSSTFTEASATAPSAPAASDMLKSLSAHMGKAPPAPLTAAVDTQVPFATDPTGQVTHLVLRDEGKDQRAEKLR